MDLAQRAVSSALLGQGAWRPEKLTVSLSAQGVELKKVRLGIPRAWCLEQCPCRSARRQSRPNRADASPSSHPQKDGGRVARIPLTRLRTIARHRDNKKGKAKVLSVIALNNPSGANNGSGYQAFVVKMATSAMADSLTATLALLCQTKAEEIQTARARDLEEGRVAQLPGNSQRFCKVGWS